MFELETQKSSNQNQKIEIGIIEAEIRIEATQLTRRIVTALLHTKLDVLYIDGVLQSVLFPLAHISVFRLINRPITLPILSDLNISNIFMYVHVHF